MATGVAVEVTKSPKIVKFKVAGNEKEFKVYPTKYQSDEPDPRWGEVQALYNGAQVEYEIGSQGGLKYARLAGSNGNGNGGGHAPPALTTKTMAPVERESIERQVIFKEAMNLLASGKATTELDAATKAVGTWLAVVSTLEAAKNQPED